MRELVEDVVSDFNNRDCDITDDMEQVEANVAMAEGIQHEGIDEADREAQGGEVKYEEAEGGEVEHEGAACREIEHEEAEGPTDLEVEREAGDHSDELDDFQSIHFDDKNGIRQRLPEFRPKRDIKNLKFHRGMLFVTTKVLKQAMRHYVILNKVNAVFENNHRNRVNAKCKKLSLDFEGITQ
ncbi:hypothetical protein CDL15_Pgr002272 [Punica granatum]|uniref:Transposase MuDR plant domain-containing protein n=1 Tax=Punica granatum TaxID=22663 RepID=A0A218WG37_PUNGR|nr:hypothetical protein CDL15_Pgr002272 [Punica granatum]